MRKKIVSLLLSFGILSTFIPNAALAADVANINQDSASQIIQKFQGLTDNNFKYDIDSSKGKVFVSGTLSSKKITNAQDALDFIDENKAIFNLNNAKDNLKVEKSEKDTLGFTHVKIGQYIDDLPIKDKVITLHYNKNGQVTNITGEVENKINSISKLGDKSLQPEDAVEIAKKEFSYTELAYEPKVETIAYIDNGQAYKTYKVNIKFYEPTITNYDVYVEASSGNILKKEDKIRYDGATTGTGIAVDNSTKSLNLYLSSGKYQLKDTTKASSGNQILTYTASNRQTEPGTLVSNTTNTFNTETLKASVSAHYYAGVVYDFYKNLFNRTSIDDSGMNLISTVHYGKSYDNAFWDGSQMVYGDGDGSTFTYLSGDLDVVGHEMTHGVTERTANLNYQDQPGALNESMSDVLGVLIETYDKYNVKNGGSWTFNSSDWVVGDDVYTPNIPGDALRSLADPTLYNQPDNMSNYDNTSDDYGGVHTNSGIPNKAAYLVAKSIGNLKTAKIYYRALTEYMISTTDFLGARDALVQAATDLYGAASNEVNTINTSFAAVGIGSSTTVNVTGVSLDTTSATLNAGDSKTLTATISPSNATNKAVTWSSSNTSVATVSSTGVVTAKAQGTAVITVTTSDGGKTATCQITVSGSTQNPTSLSEGFDGVIGTSNSITSGIPAGWTFSSGLGVYTSSGYYGTSSPSIKLQSSGNSIVTPSFSLSAQATLSFWLKGNGTDSSSHLLIEKYDGTSWTTVADIYNLPTTGTIKTYALAQNTTQVRFTYKKSLGNIGLDDIKVQ